MLIAIDGPNGVGKSTFIEQLNDCLNKEGISIFNTKEPRIQRWGILLGNLRKKKIIELLLPIWLLLIDIIIFTQKLNPC